MTAIGTPPAVGLVGLRDGIDAVPGLLRIGDAGFCVRTVASTQSDEGLDVHACGALFVTPPEDPGAAAMLAERVAAAAPLLVGTVLPFGGRRVRCNQVKVTVDASGVVSFCADFADEVLSMARADDRATYRAQLRNALRMSPKLERHLDEGGAP